MLIAPHHPPFTRHRVAYPLTVAVFLLATRVSLLSPLTMRVVRCCSLSRSRRRPLSSSLIRPRSSLQKSKQKNHYKNGTTTYILYDVEVALRLKSTRRLCSVCFVCLPFFCFFPHSRCGQHAICCDVDGAMSPLNREDSSNIVTPEDGRVYRHLVAARPHQQSSSSYLLF